MGLVKWLLALAGRLIGRGERCSGFFDFFIRCGVIAGSICGVLILFGIAGPWVRALFGAA